MEWISFNLDNDKKNIFENQLLPELWKSHGPLLEMSGLTWAAYSTGDENGSNRYLFNSDSRLFLNSIKKFIVAYSRVHSEPDTTGMLYFGPENLE
jgi:hypothetical protein